MGDTIFGQVEIGGSPVDLTVNVLLSRILEIEAKLKIQLDRSKSQGVIFGDLAFPGEADFMRWFTPLNASGRGMAGFVDIVSI